MTSICQLTNLSHIQEDIYIFLHSFFLSFFLTTSPYVFIHSHTFASLFTLDLIDLRVFFRVWNSTKFICITTKPWTFYCLINFSNYSYFSLLIPQQAGKLLVIHQRTTVLLNPDLLYARDVELENRTLKWLSLVVCIENKWFPQFWTFLLPSKQVIILSDRLVSGSKNPSFS